MKKSILIAILVMVTGVFFYACQDNTVSDSSSKNGKDGARIQACTFVTLSGALTTQTLVNTNTYLISGIVRIPSGVTLTIPAGTKLQGVKSATTAWLVIERGGKLIANGTATNPVVFTSDQAPGSRLPGDWGGIAFAGRAAVNVSPTLDIPLSAGYTLVGGGSTAADNSGTLQNVQIHFAGKGYTNIPSQSALILNAIGSGTTIDKVQITNSNYDGVSSLGGTVKETNIISYNAGRTDFVASFGYVGIQQFISAMRLNNTAVPTGPAYGYDISNNLISLTTATPITKPIISNLTVQGPNYCSATTVNSNFMYAMRVRDNGTVRVFNSVLSSFNTSATQSGLRIEGAGTIAQTALPSGGPYNLEFSYNSFHNSGTTPYSSNPATWVASGGCDGSMALWMGSGTDPCVQTGNQFSVTTLGYNSSFCSNFCSSFTSNFTLGTTTLSAANFSWDPAPAKFSHPTYRGAFGSTDWTTGWTDWCPQSTVYC